ncbi:MAG: 1-acyl-sn-glycerol-3-phosphate acyltransferase [Solirubrobacterales bacterium]|nr:1-acyl-sn-glycerol-3-phosphate acyltransferase [Solirubrobacterales bacterium]
MRVQTPGRGPLFPDDGPLGPRIKRRTVGMAAEIFGFLLLTVLSPLLMLIALLVDSVLWVRNRRPFVTIRMIPAIWWFLFGEMKAYLKLVFIYAFTGGPWGRGSIRRRRWIYALRIAWARNHLIAIRILFGLKFELENLQVTTPGAYILMPRHVSILDNLIGDVFIGHPQGIGVRYVIKEEIRALTPIDIGGRWIPTVFVKRGSLDPDTEIAAVRALTHDMSPGEIMAIYPEGTRPTPAKIARAQEVIAERQPGIWPMAARLNHLLPPRLGGPLAILDEAAAGTDIVFCGHVGFEGLRTVKDVWAGVLVGREIKIRFWRYDGTTIPEGDDLRTEWLYEKWQMIDDWVGEELAARGESD